MPLFRRKKKIREALPEAPEYGFPEVEEMDEIIKRRAKTKEREPRKKLKLVKLPEVFGKSELPELPEFPEEEPKKPRVARVTKEEPEKRPLFIRVDQFKEILDSVNVIEKRIKEISVIISRLKEIRDLETETMQQWEEKVQELNSKLKVIEKNLSKIE